MNRSDYGAKFKPLKTVSFTEPHDGFVLVNVNNANGKAVVSLYGAHVMSFSPAGQTEVLWMSNHSFWEKGKPIRGGVPICWPWFGPNPTDATKPAHGLARLQEWTLTSVTESPAGDTVLVLTLTDSPATRALWDKSFRLEMEVSVGKTLKMTLTTTNTGSESFVIGEALHTYFTISDINKVSIDGFDGCSYLDSLTGKLEKQQGDVVFSAETDRVYFVAEGENTIIDPVLKRRISNIRHNSACSVVWNPWIEKSKRMPDFGDDEFPGMLCLETANAKDKQVTVMPQQSHAMTATVVVK